MASSTRISVAVVSLTLLGGSVLQPVLAACSTARTLKTAGAYLVSNPAWGGAGGDRTCTFDYGCYADDPDGGAQAPPISSAFSGWFWALAHGDPGPGGLDNGTWGAADWTKQRTADFGQPYYYAAFLTTDTGGNSTAGNPPSWGSDARIDGCITDAINPGQIDPEECTCVLLSDEWADISYFAVLANFTGPIGDFDLTVASQDAAGADTVRLGPLPPPLVVAATLFDVGPPALWNISVATDELPAAAVQMKGGCDCAVQYEVYTYRTQRAAPVPVDRSDYCTQPDEMDCWVKAPSATGGIQQPTPITQEASIRVVCDPFEDLYMSTRLVIDPSSAGGFVTASVSQNSARLTACDEIYAEPKRPTDRGRTPFVPRGRKESDRTRGDRQR